MPTTKPPVKILFKYLSSMEMAGMAWKVIRKRYGKKEAGRYIVKVLKKSDRESVLEVINEYCEIE